MTARGRTKASKTGLDRRQLIAGSLTAGVGAFHFNAWAGAQAGPHDTESTSGREVWLSYVERVSRPVLKAMSRGQLRKSMPVEALAGHEEERAPGSPLEAAARLLCGLAPWFELPLEQLGSDRERALQVEFRSMAVAGLKFGLDASAPDYLRFGSTGQTLVDAAFLALAFLRAPRALLAALDATGVKQVFAALVAVRSIQPPYMNWLLFSALNEVLLRRMGADWDRMRIDYALRSHQLWYLGDGTYGDGPSFHADYYNSYVIQPFLLAIANELGDDPQFRSQLADIRSRATRYAEIQERSIAPGGEFPLIGRSLAYRAGAFHLLADAALRGMLPAAAHPASVRCALASVQRLTLEPKGTFHPDGWLQIGLAGHQPGIAETYISTGSLYLCSTVWLPLGLPAADVFWVAPDQPWTQKRIWGGGPATADHALSREG